MKIRAFVIVLLLAAAAFAKDPQQIINWPSDDNPVLRFSVTKVHKLESFSGTQVYNIDVTAQNLSARKIDSAQFHFYLFDRNRVRVADGTMQIQNVSPQESIKLQLTAQAVGTPATMSIEAEALPADLAKFGPARAVTVTVFSVPAGAALKVDGKDAGITPVGISVPVGSHVLQFQKAGFNTGNFPLVITRDQLSGGSVTYELGTSAHDTIELRDGTTITGDVDSIAGMDVTIRVGGTPQHYDRNQIKRIIFTEREPAPKQ